MIVLFNGRYRSSVFESGPSPVDSGFSVRYRFKTTKMEQKIETGGNSKTRMPILKFLMNRAFEFERTALHIEHCATAGECMSRTTPIIKAINTSVRDLLVFHITVPPQLEPLVATPEICSAASRSENCRGRKQRVTQYKSPARARS